MVVLLVASTLAAAAASSALLADLHLRTVRNRADALTAESAALAGAAVAEAVLRSALARSGALPASLVLPDHSELRYTVLEYERLIGLGARVRLGGVGRADGRAEVALEVVVNGGGTTVRVLR
jgi:hypothetical protein